MGNTTNKEDQKPFADLERGYKTFRKHGSQHGKCLKGLTSGFISFDDSSFIEYLLEHINSVMQTEMNDDKMNLLLSSNEQKNTNIQDGNRDRFYAEKELADINSLYASSFKSAESHISELQNGDYEKYFTVIENDHKVYRNLQI